MGYVFGTGGAVVVNIFNIWIDRVEGLRPFKLRIMRIPFNLVWIGLVLMLIVHTGEAISDPTDAVHWAKIVAIYPILAGLSYIKFSLIPKMLRVMPKPGEQPSKEFLSIRRRSRILPPILLSFWFADFVLNTIWEPTHAFDFAAK